MKLFLIGCAALGLATAAYAQSVSPSQFLAKAGASDRFEIESAKIESGTSNPNLAAFANQMVTDHTKSTMMVKQAAKADGLAPMPPVLDAEQKQDLADLGAASRMARDTLYVSQQKVAHAQALALMQDFAAGGSAANLKVAASQIVPVVQMHKDMIDKM